MKRYAIFVLLPLLVFVSACSNLKPLAGQSANAPDHTSTPDTKKAGAVNVPQNVKNAVSDPNILKDATCILTMPNANDILLGERNLTKDTLGKEIGDCLGQQPVVQRIVYVKADNALDYGNIVDGLSITRKVDGDRIRFIVSPTDDTNNPKNVLKVKVPGESYNTGSKPLKPNPLTLVVSLTNDGKITLNADGHDSFASLSARLKEIFKTREDNGVIREGTGEVEKTVFVKAPRSMKYGEVIKAIDAVTGSGADPIGLQIDDLAQ